MKKTKLKKYNIVILIYVLLEVFWALLSLSEPVFMIPFILTTIGNFIYIGSESIDE
jgi:hypothetical protein